MRVLRSSKPHSFNSSNSRESSVNKQRPFKMPLPDLKNMRVLRSSKPRCFSSSNSLKSSVNKQRPFKMTLPDLKNMRVLRSSKPLLSPRSFNSSNSRKSSVNKQRPFKMQLPDLKNMRVLRSSKPRCFNSSNSRESSVNKQRPFKMPLPDLFQTEALHRDILNRNKTAFNQVIERYISLAHGLPPPLDECPYQSPHNSKNKPSSTPLYPQKNLSRTGATIKTSTVSPAISLRQDSCCDEDDLVREVEESLQRRKQQLGLSDDFICEEIEDNEVDEDDPTWDGSHYHARVNLPSRLHEKRKLSDNLITNTVGSSDENKSRKKAKAPVDEVSLSQNKTADLRQLSVQDRLSDVSNLPRRRGRPSKRKSVLEVNDEGNISKKRCRSPKQKSVQKVSDEGDTSRKRGRQPKAKMAAESQENLNQNNPRNEPKRRGRPPKKNKTLSVNPTKDKTSNTRSGDENKEPKRRGRPSKKNKTLSLNPTKDKTSNKRSGDENKEPKRRGRPSKKNKTLSLNPTKDKTSNTRSGDENKEPKRRGRPSKKNKTLSLNPTKDKTSNTRSGDENKEPKRRGRPSKKNKTLSLNPTKDKTSNTRSGDENNVPQKRGRPFKQKATGTLKIHTQDCSVVLRRLGGGSEGILSVNKTNETRTLCSIRGAEEEQRPQESSDDIVKLVQEAVGGTAGILHRVEYGKHIICLLDTMDTMLIMVNQNVPSETSTGKETEATTGKTSKKEKKKAQEREQSTRTHTGSNMEANTQVEQTVNKITNIEKRKKVDQTAKKTNNKEKEKKAIEKQQTVDKKARSSTRTESSLHHKAMQQSESTVEHPTVKKMGQNNSRKREHISNAVKSPKRQRNESSVPAKASVATHLAIDAMLSPGQNSSIVPSSEGNVLKRLHVDPDAGTDKVTGQFMQHEPPNTGESPNQPKKARDLEVSDRSLSSDGSESESQDEDGWLTDSDEDDMISEFSTTQKKKSSLHRTQERLKRRNYSPKHRESVSKAIFDSDDDILIMEPPKPVPISENKKDNTNSENSQSTKGVQGRPIMASPYVSLKTQRPIRRAAGGHQQSLTTCSSYIQGLISNSIMKNVPEMMTSASTRIPVDGQTEEEPDPEDMWDLLSALPQRSSSSLAARAAKTSLQESGITETAATAPERPTTVTSTNISGAVITSKASKVKRSFWIESEEEEEGEDKDTEDTESLFMPTLPLASQLIQESTVLPSYSSLGPEHWMSVARAMQKRKKFQTEALHRDILNRNKTAFNQVIERYISLAHGLPPPIDECPYQSPHNSKNKPSSTPLYPQKNLSRTGATIKTSTVSPAISLRQDSCCDEDDLVREVEESLQRRKQQLGLSDDFICEEIEDNEVDEDDPTWDGSHYHARVNLPSRLHKKRKLSDNLITNTVGLSDENKSRKKAKAPVDEVSLSQNKTADLRQLSVQDRLSDVSNLPRRRGRPSKRKSVLEVNDEGNISKKRCRSPKQKSVQKVSDEGDTSRKRGRQPKAKVTAESQENLNQNNPRNEPKRRGRPSKKNKTLSLNPTKDKTSNTRSGDENKEPKRRGRPSKKNTTLSLNPTKDKTSNIRSGDENKEPKRRGRPSKKNKTLSLNPTKDKTSNTRSGDENNVPQKRGRPFKQKATGTLKIHTQDCSVVLRRLGGGSEGILSVNKTNETRTVCSIRGAEEEQRPQESSDDIVKLVQEAVGGTAGILHRVEYGKHIICLLDTMDTMLITVNQNVPSETSTGKETEATTGKTSKKEKKKAQEREQSTRTHTGSNMEANTQVEQTVNKITNIEKRKKVDQTAKKTNNKEKEKKAIEKQQTVDKKARSSTRTETSLHHKAMQQSESTVEHPTVKKMGQNNSRKREHISNAVKSPKRQRNESSVPAKASVATHLAIDAMLSPGQNSSIVPSSEGNVLKRLHVDPDAGTDKVTGQFMQHEPPNTGESPNQPKKARDLEVSDRSLSSDGSESESQDEDGWLTDSDEDDMISEFSTTQKKKSSLHRTQERLKRRNYSPKHRESVSKAIFDSDDDILIMEPPKPVPISENKKDNTNSENSQSTKGVQGRPIMASPYVSLKTQRPIRRAAGGHQQSLTTCSSYIQGLISNSIMKNVPEMMTSASTRIPVDGQTEEEPDPEDMWDLLPALPQRSSSSLAARAAKTSLQESCITETAATAPERPTTVTSTNISGAVITSKASKVKRSFWIESEEEEEEEDKDTEDTESLFMPTLPVASQLIQESTVLPNYSSLGPEHWMSVARAMQKRKKNSFLRLTFL
ncbi:uncharacterized protein LOC127006077 isoform X7 [Eriocheir sinensis]|uniref:uncharacterized protein LOC127006077 isoform X7 n=1 Tax=Eriocheir sinensis TaxID=95602 RepID=UPI0021C96AF7|nr:uncharacterized protein LOC127006077 isoform X7 [Eriocheir sinensis]